MKKLYALFLVVFILNSSSLFSQVPSCQYDYTWLSTGKNGVWPDSATNFSGGTVGAIYTQNITIKVPNDTVTTVFGPPQTLHFDRVELSNPTGFTNYGLPPGLSLACTPSTCKFPGNDTSCMVIYGTPTTAGTYNLGFKLTTYVQEIPNVAINTSTLTYYKIIIAAANGINTFNASTFEVAQSMPNPATNKAIITYNLPGEGKTKLSVYNILGKLMLEKREDGQKGENEFEVNCKEMPSGVCIYNIEYNGKTITRRMIVAQ